MTKVNCSCGSPDRGTRGWRDPHCGIHGEFPPVPLGESPKAQTKEQKLEALRARMASAKTTSAAGQWATGYEDASHHWADELDLILKERP
jgi:hypothetical protein